MRLMEFETKSGRKSCLLLDHIESFAQTGDGVTLRMTSGKEMKLCLDYQMFRDQFIELANKKGMD